MQLIKAHYIQKSIIKMTKYNDINMLHRRRKMLVFKCKMTEA